MAAACSAKVAIEGALASSEEVSETDAADESRLNPLLLGYIGMIERIVNPKVDEAHGDEYLITSDKSKITDLRLA